MKHSIGILLALGASLMLHTQPVPAGDGTWTNLAGGSWTNAANWRDGVIADGAGSTADFTTLGQHDVIVTLDGPRTIGSLLFGNTNNMGSGWVLVGSGGWLTLDVATGRPAITVIRGFADLFISLAGTKGFAKSGDGTLALYNYNTYTGGTYVNVGTLTIAMPGDASRSVLPPGRPVTVNPGAILRLEAQDSMGSLGGYPSLVTVNRGSVTGHSIQHVGNLALEAGTIIGGVSGDTGSYIFDGSITTLPADASSVITSEDPNPIELRGALANGRVVFDVADGLAPVDLAVDSPLTGAAQLVKVGAGTLLLMKDCDYTGDTIVSNGTLAVWGGIVGCTKIQVAAGAVLDVSAEESNFLLTSGTMLQGDGTVRGTLTVASGATVSPGRTSVGTLTFSAPPILQGTVAMELNKSGSTLSSDRIAVNGRLDYVGTLRITISGDTLAPNDTFQLFEASGGFDGRFTRFDLPLLPGLSWDATRLAVDGTLRVIAGGGVVLLSDPTVRPGTTLYAGQKAILSIEADSTEVLHYQWYRGTEALSNATNAVLTLASVATTDAGFYHVVLSNRLGITTSEAVRLDVVVPSAGSYPAVVAGLQPVAYWPLNEVVPGTVYDVWGQHHGTHGAAASVAAAGPRPPLYPAFEAVNLAVSCNGNDQAGIAMPALDLNTNRVTLACWIKRSGDQRESSSLMVGKVGDVVRWSVSFGTHNDLLYRWYADGGTYRWSSGLVPPEGQWTFVALVVEPERVTIYMSQGDHLVRAIFPAAYVPAEFDGAVELGQDSRGSFSYVGLLDEVTIFDRVLSPDQLRQLSLSAYSQSTVAWWRFEAGPTNGYVHHAAATGVFSPDSEDSSGNGNALSAWDEAGSGYLYRTNRPGPNIPQTGDDNNLSVQNDDLWPALFTGSEFMRLWTPPAFTIEASFKPQAGGWRTLVGRDSWGAAPFDYDAAALYFQITPEDAVAIKFCDVSRVWHQAVSTNGAVVGFPAGNPDAGRWYHMAAVSDGTTLSLYLNQGGGYDLVAQANLSARSTNTALTTGFEISVNGPHGDWSVGRGMYKGIHDNRACGFIDEVRISDGALAPREFLFASSPPVVLVDTQPFAQAVCVGQAATFTASFTGSREMSYQWETSQDGGSTYTSVSGGTSTNLILSNVQSVDAGLYRLRAWNPYGTNVSSPARLEVIAGTVAWWRFEEGPSGAQLNHGGAADGMFVPGVLDSSGNGNALSVWAEGWAGYTHTTDLPEAIIPATCSPNRYSVQNSGWAPCLFTGSELMRTWTPSAFTIEVSFKPETGGYRTLVGRDSRGAATIDTNLAALYLQIVPGDAIAIKFCDVSGVLHEAVSAPGAVTGFPYPNAAAGHWYHLAAVSDGTNLTLYLNSGLGFEQVAQSDMTISESPNTALTAGLGTGSDWVAGTWSVGRGLYAGGHTDRAYGFIDEVRITAAALNPTQFLFGHIPKSVITQQPEAVNVLAGGRAILSVQAESQIPLSYQWRKDGTNFGAPKLANTFTLDGVTTTDGGDYTVVVGNCRGMVTSEVAHVEVIVPPVGSYAATIARFRPVAYWPLNETVPGTVHDVWAGHHGTHGAEATVGVEGPQPADSYGLDSGNRGVFFSGTNNSWIALPALNLNTNTVTFTCWIRYTNSQPNMAGVAYCRTVNTAAGLWIYANDLAYHWDKNYCWYWLGGDTMGPWVFWAMVFTPSNATWYVSTNTTWGEKVTQIASNDETHSIAPFDGTLYLGQNSGGPRYQGFMDEVAIFNRALTTNEIMRLIHASTLPLRLTIRIETNSCILNWPGPATLQAADTVEGAPWESIPTLYDIGPATIPIDPAKPCRYFRLLRPEGP